MLGDATCACPPCNIGPRSTPELRARSPRQAVHTLGRRPDGVRRPARRRLLRRPRRDLRPRRPAAVPEPAPDPDRPTRAGRQRDRTASTCTPSRSRCPISELTADGSTPTDVRRPPVGHRRLGRGQPRSGRGSATPRPDDHAGRPLGAGLPAGQPAVQRGDHADGREGQLEHASTRPTTGSSLQYVAAPRARRAAAGALPGRVPEPGRPTRKPRADLVAILLTGIPAGIVPGFQNYTGTVLGRHAAAQHGDPADRASPSPLGLLGGDLPASRTAGASPTTWSRSSCGRSPARRIPLVDPSYTPDAAAALITDGLDRHQHALPAALPVPRHTPGGYQTAPLATVG